MIAPVILAVLTISISSVIYWADNSQKPMNYLISESKQGDLLDYHYLKTFTPEEAMNYINTAGKATTKESATWVKEQLGEANYFVDAYIVEYASVNSKNDIIPVSGVVLIPQEKEGVLMPLLVYQHGTIIKNNAAPSISIASKSDKATGQSNTLLGSFAAYGYIVAMTDYAGTGQENCLAYPSEYLFSKSEGENGVDILIVTDQLLKEMGVMRSENLFIAGYSEGGQAVSAMGEQLQNNYPEYKVTAAAFMEGPYDMNETMNSLLKTPGGIALGGEPVGSLICAKAIYAYKNIYDWGAMNTVFNHPYDKRVEKQFSNPNTSAIILGLSYPINTQKMFQASFLDNAENGSVAADIAKNNTDDWIPEMPVTIMTSSADTLIPDTIAKKTYEKMLNAGGNVRLEYTKYPLNHLENFLQSIVQAKGIFDGHINLNK